MSKIPKYMVGPAVPVPPPGPFYPVWQTNVANARILAYCLRPEDAAWIAGEANRLEAAAAGPNGERVV